MNEIKTREKNTLKDFEEFKEAYRNCKGETFKYEGEIVLKRYAEYLIEYLEEVVIPSELNSNENKT